MNRYIAFLILLTFPFVSCSDFLEEKQVNTLTQDFYNNEDGLESLISGCYGVLRAKVEWSDNGSGELLELGTDQYLRGNETPRSKYDVGTWAPNGAIGTVVNRYLGHSRSDAGYGMYPSINSINIAIDKILSKQITGKFAQTAYAESRLAEVLFLRSWIYYSLTAQLGEVPLILEPNVGMPENFVYPKATVEAVYKQIIADLRRAFEGAPPTQSEKGRITKWAVGHLLAKCYLARAQAASFKVPTDVDRTAANPTVDNINNLRYKGNVSTDLDSCIHYATLVIEGCKPNNPAYGGLESDFYSLFKIGTNDYSANDCKEVLLAAQYSNNLTLNSGYGERICNYFIGAYDWAGGNCNIRTLEYGRPFSTYKPTDFVYDAFTDKVNDSRYYKTFRFDFNATYTTNTSIPWNASDAAYFNANLRKPAEREAKAGERRNLFGERGVLYVENTYDEPLDSAWVAAQPFILTARWIRGKNGAMYYRAGYRGVEVPTGMSFVGLETGITNQYPGSMKYVDPNRGGASVSSEAGTRNVILARLAEVYLIRAEACGRQQKWNEAVADINVLRSRAAYKASESRAASLVEYNPQGMKLPAAERIFPYTVQAGTYENIKISEAVFTPGTPQSNSEPYIASVRNRASKDEMFIHFIYNEKAREFHSELLSWEDQANAGILYERANFFNQMASSLRTTTPGQTGYGPAATVIGANGGQDGLGRGAIAPKHMIRMWPTAYLDNLTTIDGQPLNTADPAAYAKYQNPGYK